MQEYRGKHCVADAVYLKYYIWLDSTPVPPACLRRRIFVINICQCQALKWLSKDCCLNCNGLRAGAQLCEGLWRRAVGRRGSGIIPLSSCTCWPSWQCGCWQSSSLTLTVAQSPSKTDWSFQCNGSTQASRPRATQEERLLTLSKAYTQCRDTPAPKGHLHIT